MQRAGEVRAVGGLETHLEFIALRRRELGNRQCHRATVGVETRARNLQRAAQTLLRDHGGQVPATPSALLELPGIGRYTAGAIASIAFNQPDYVDITIDDLSLAIPNTGFDVHHKIFDGTSYFEIKCSGEFSANMKNTKVTELLNTEKL